MATTTEHESEQVEPANATGLAPVVFVHGLWLLPSSWDRWAALFEEAGYTALTPGALRQALVFVVRAAQCGSLHDIGEGEQSS